jgi:hypothetical protein
VKTVGTVWTPNTTPQAGFDSAYNSGQYNGKFGTAVNTNLGYFLVNVGAVVH